MKSWVLPGEHAVLAPAGPQAARLSHLWWVFLAICTAVYVVMMILLVIALARRSEGALDPRRVTTVVASGGALTAATLVGLLIFSVRAGRGINPLVSAAGASEVLTVRVTGHQWWWDFEYEASPPSQMVRASNELHIPVGQPVLLRLISSDVVHSFWVPSLHGKRDLVPGHESTTYIQADRAGLFRGQCAEFCGDQHAQMAFSVIAESPGEFQAWLRQQRQIAPEPATALARRGREVFLSTSCSMCHTIVGTPAGSRVGPDLTHVASRLTIAAGSLANGQDRLAAWITDPHGFKPGVRMPPNPLPSGDLQALVSYLGTLQ
jgi:cytochrome c oxidase subunit 2